MRQMRKIYSPKNKRNKLNLIFCGVGVGVLVGGGARGCGGATCAREYFGFGNITRSSPILLYINT